VGLLSDPTSERRKDQPVPRINAPSVAEHHANQRRALLLAARELLAETGQAPSMAAVGKRAGLARTSLYQYFPSVDDLVAAIVADVFPEWGARVLDRVSAAPTPAARVWAYVGATVDLFASSEQDLARALARIVAPDVLRGPMEEFHARIQQPLRDALADFGESEPEQIAELIDTMVITTSRAVATTATGDAARNLALARLRRLLGPYLGLS
jgi:AcrR family transcriptional regulator